MMNWYEIRVQGHLDQRWSEWFEGLAISYDGDNSTLLRGPLVDEASLHGVLIKIRDLAVPLLAVNRVSGDAAVSESRDAKPGTRDSVGNKREGERHATGSVDGTPADEGTSRP